MSEKCTVSANLSQHCPSILKMPLAVKRSLRKQSRLENML
uniref:Uncharacterized protein n=1 Tax=Picea sitchensis TaxID=3332 RepID=A9P1Q0_PICSI|nr:unknown [Picea sitchensis]